MARLRKLRSGSFELRTKAFPFQREAIDAVRHLEYSAVFFEQGLGKTKIAIDLALDWLSEEIVDTVIIVTKKGLIRNWLEEFGFHSNVTPRVISSDSTANHRAFFSPARVYLANFEAIAKETERIKKLARHRSMAAIVDESQKIKNPDSALTKAFLDISSIFKKRVIMTGTPMANRPHDIWSQIYFLDGGDSLGRNFPVFKAKLDIPREPVTRGYAEALEALFPKISKFAIRQTKEGSGLDLPGKHFRTVVADWEHRQRKMYVTVRDELKLEVQRDDTFVVDDAEVLLKRLLRLVQISSNPKLVDDSYENTPGKLVALKRLLQDAVGASEKAIVWTSFVDNCRLLKEGLSDFGAVQLHGRMDMNRRDMTVRKFKADSATRILVATPAAAKEGLTLTVANHVIYFDRSFSLDDYVQSQDRIHRISQTRECFVHNIVLSGSVDEWTDALLDIKAAAVGVAMGDSDSEGLSEHFNEGLADVLRVILDGK